MRTVKAVELLIFMWMVGCAAAYSNDTMTDAYLKLVHGDPIHAIHDANTAVWGDWFWIILASGPYIAMYLHQRSLDMATIWLTCILVAYGGLMLTGMIPAHVIYLLAAVWVTTVLVRLLSPTYTN